jgi:sulfatase maturation enzyme AslB (radical SAM superfamily)
LVDKFIYDVEEIYFAGGEPLVMDENYLILEKLIEAGRTDVTLRYNTNFSHLTYKKWDLFDMWMKFQNDPKGSVSLFASLDAAGELAEVVRNGTNWPRVEENLKKCIDAGINVVFSPTVSLLNMYHIDKLIESAERVGLNPNSFSVHNLLTDPQYYDIRLLPDYLKESFINKLKNYKENGCPNNFKIIVQKIIDVWGDYIHQEFSGDRFYWEKELIRITEGLDKLRNEDFLRVNPQYTEWFADIKKRLVNGII